MLFNLQHVNIFKILNNYIYSLNPYIRVFLLSIFLPIFIYLYLLAYSYLHFYLLHKYAEKLRVRGYLTCVLLDAG